MRGDETKSSFLYPLLCSKDDEQVTKRMTLVKVTVERMISQRGMTKRKLGRSLLYQVRARSARLSFSWGC